MPLYQCIPTADKGGRKVSKRKFCQGRVARSIILFLERGEQPDNIGRFKTTKMPCKDKDDCKIIKYGVRKKNIENKSDSEF